MGASALRVKDDANGQSLYTGPSASGTCALFWGIAAASLLLGSSVGPSLLLLGAGIACNAAVTLANGGFMPVSTHWKRKGPARSLWVQRQGGQRLLFLADNFGNRFVRFSVGDVSLAIGLIVSFLPVLGIGETRDSRDWQTARMSCPPPRSGRAALREGAGQLRDVGDAGTRGNTTWDMKATLAG